MRRLRLEGRWLLGFAATGVVACTALGVGVFLSAYASLTRTAFHDRANAYARAFAVTVDSWLARSQLDVAQTLADVLVTGSVRSVEILSADGRVVVRAGEPNTAASTREHADVEMALPSSGGSVRIQVDDASAALVIRHAALLAVGAALLFDAAVVGILAWALRGRRRTSSPVSTGGREKAGEERIAVGQLEILPARCEAWYAGKALELTPKQFALLSVLAGDPGRVFTEAEILDAAWPDSPYADARDIKQYVYLLRRRFAAIRPEGRDVIVTVPGFGYRLDDGR